MQLFPGRLPYLVVLALGAVDGVWIAVDPRLQLAVGQLVWPLCGVLAALACAAIIARHRPTSERMASTLYRLSCLMQGMVFLQLSWITLRLFNHLSMSLGLPYVDDMLARSDALIALSWTEYFEFVRHSRLRPLLEGSYTSLTVLSVLAFTALMVLRDLRRAKYFLETSLITALACTVVGMLFPAVGSVATYVGPLSDFSDFTAPPGLYFVESLARLREDPVIALDLQHLPGLVTFPSFHTAAGVLLAASFWRTRGFWIASAYSVVMIAATPVFGGHYFIDLIGGALTAAVVLRAFAVLPYYHGMFRRAEAIARPIGQAKPARSAATATG